MSSGRRHKRNTAPNPLSKRESAWPGKAIPLAVAGLTFLCFALVLQHDFVNWDDDVNFLSNPHYRGLALENLRWMFSDLGGHYIPVTWLTLGVDYVLWGMNPMGYHLTSVLIHCGSAVLFYFVLLELLRRAQGSTRPGMATRYCWIAAAGALFFSIHPLRVESVAWVTERRDVVSGFFLLLTVLTYLWAQSENGRSAVNPRWFVASVACFGLSLLSKVLGLGLPLILLILDAYPLRRFRERAEWRRILGEKLPYLVLSLAALIMAVTAALSTNVFMDDYPLIDRFLQPGYRLLFYLWKTLLPFSLSPTYPYEPAGAALVGYLACSVAVFAMGLGLLWKRRIWPAALGAFLAYAILLGPMLGLVQNAKHATADRYSYLASLPIAAFFIALVSWLELRTSIPPRALAWAVALVLAGFGIRTIDQSRIWQNTEALWDHALTVNPNDYIARAALGAELSAQGRLEEAAREYERALDVKPDLGIALINLTSVYAKLGRLDEGSELAARALEVRPSIAAAHLNRGYLLFRSGHPGEAIRFYRQALEIRPSFPKALRNLAEALKAEGRLEEAVEAYEAAIEVSPHAAELHKALAYILLSLEQPELARHHLQTALRTKPKDPVLHNNLANVLRVLGLSSDAVRHYRVAIRERPEYVVAHWNLGAILAEQGQVTVARKHFEEVLRLQPDHPQARASLQTIADRRDGS